MITAMIAPAPENLSGLWHGQYNYPNQRPPTPFVATLLDQDGALSGSITEQSTLPPRVGQPLYATVRGQRDHTAVTFLKSYESDDSRYAIVTYEGRISGDLTEIEGTWRTRGWQGRFLMIRGTSRVMTVETGILETIR